MNRRAEFILLVGVLAILIFAITGGAAWALPSGSVQVTDPYDTAGDPAGGVTLPGLVTATANNVPVYPDTEHDRSRADNGAGLIGFDGNTGALTSSGPHGRYTDNTASCGRCHALHTAQGKRLIRFQVMPSGSTANNTIYGTCTFCHSFNGQSTYDVKDGMIWDTFDGKRYATSGGGFERMLVVEGEPALATVVKASSSHRVNYREGTKFRIPGAYDGVNTNLHLELTCSSCHNPHGDVMSRQLRKQVLVPEKISGTMQLKNTYNVDFIKIQPQNLFGDESVAYNEETVYFCIACHQDYATANGGAWANKRRHKVNYDLDVASTSVVNFNAAKFNLPVATIGNGSSRGVLICMTCHYAHGTFVRVKGIPTADQIIISSSDNSLDLQNLDGTRQEPPKNLRMDNRGVCQNCHNWKDVSPNPPQLVDVLEPGNSGVDLYGEPATLRAGVKALAKTSRTIVIRFNQYVLKGADVNSAESIANYTLTENGLPFSLAGATAKVQPDGKSVVLRLAADLNGADSYQLQVQNIKDTNLITMNSTVVPVTLNW